VALARRVQTRRVHHRAKTEVIGVNRLVPFVKTQRNIMVNQLYNRFFAPTPQRHQSLAWALNPAFLKVKYLGLERAKMCDTIAMNEIKRRQASDTCTATEVRAEPKEAAPSKKRVATLMDAVDSSMDWADDTTEGAPGYPRVRSRALASSRTWARRRRRARRAQHASVA